MLIHITGASGSGTSTAGEALAARLGVAHLDTDDFFWLPTDPPFRHKRPADERRSSLLDALRSGGDAVVSGAVNGWGDEIENAFDLIVFLYVETDIRLARLRERELRRFGKVNPDFMTWAAQYDEGPPEGRGLAKQKAWLGARACPVLVLEGDLSTHERLERIYSWMAANPR
jgi:adenylate kinase family enzyme